MSWAAPTPHELVRQVLDRLAYTAAMRDLDGHAECVSRKLKVYGVPGQDVIEYDAWLQRRRNELTRPLLSSLGYRNIQVVLADETEIRFTVSEVMRGTDGKVMVLDKEVLLALEDDGHWRVRMDHIRNATFRKN